MPDPLAVIIRFDGDSDDLLGRFERVRQSWTKAQGAGYERPSFYAGCRTNEGIAIVTAWESAVAHRAFGQGLHAYIDAHGMRHPDRIERLRVAKLGWD